ncbi:MAG: phosphatase PAP2 family protein [Terracidiphilus sp.]|nr:phosphatase PAP2 family protein [Terracidiphilus sp.]MDR3798276.1 phosphatase PAP2 family protein [Terracidiphilus sp.]
MLDFVRSYLDELLTSLFLLLVAVLTVAYPPHFATPGGLLLARVVLWSAAILVCALLAASRFSPRAAAPLHFVFAFGPIVVAVVGYSGLQLLSASVITAWLGIPSFDHEMMAADLAIFGKSPYLWFMRWGLDSGLFARIMSGFYALYPFTPLLAVGWFLWRDDTKQFRLVRRALIISLYSGYVFYLLIPVSGPLSLAGATSPTFLESTSVYSFLESNFRYPYDCFPSLHTANPWLIVWLSRGKVPGWLMASAVTAACGITLSTIVLEVHYGIDVLAGLAWVFLIAAVAKATLPNAAYHRSPDRL